MRIFFFFVFLSSFGKYEDEKRMNKILSFLFFSSRQWGGQTTTHTFFFCIHHTPFHYFMPMPLILFVLSQHFMTQINIFYLCHTYAIISIKKNCTIAHHAHHGRPPCFKVGNLTCKSTYFIL